MEYRTRQSSLNRSDKEEAIARYKTTMRSNWESGQLSNQAIFGVVQTPTSTHWVPLRMNTDANALTVADFQLESRGDATQSYSMEELSHQDVFHHPTLGPIPAFANFAIQPPRPGNEQSFMQTMINGSNASDPTEYSWNSRDSNYMARPSSAWLVRANWQRLSNASPGTPLPFESMDAKSLVPMMMPSDQVSLWTLRANALGAKLKSMRAATEGDSQGVPPI